MKYYHASNREIAVGDNLRTKTGRGDGNILHGGAVFFTSDIDACKRYGSFVYVVSVKNAVPYKQALQLVGRSKKARYTRGVYVAKPADTIIASKLA